MKLTDGLREVPWPNKPPASRWPKGASERKGEFVGDARSKSEQDAWEANYRRRRIRCAMTELYNGFGAWLTSPNGEVRGLSLQAAMKAHAALKKLGADDVFKLQDPG